MTLVIHVQPAEAWGFYTKNQRRLEEELVEIATNEETNTSVYMTDEDGMPYLYVYKDDRKIFQEECSTIYATERSLRTIYAKYLSPLKMAVPDSADDGKCSLAESDSDLDEMSEAEFQDIVDEREDAIYSSIQALIEVLTEDPTYAALECIGADDNIDDIVDHIVEYLAIKCGFRIRRPMNIRDDDTGLIVRTEYPYEEFDFSDEELHS